MIPFYPVACLGHMISNGRRMAVTHQRLLLRLFSETVAELSFFPCKDRLCDDCYIGKTKRRLHNRKTEYFKALTEKLSFNSFAHPWKAVVPPPLLKMIMKSLPTTAEYSRQALDVVDELVCGLYHSPIKKQVCCWCEDQGFR